jgi:hypothetical protein
MGLIFLRIVVEEIILTKDQIENIIQLHDHFKHLQSFTIALEDNGNVAVKFKLTDLKSKQQTQFVKKLI